MSREALGYENVEWDYLSLDGAFDVASSFVHTTEQGAGIGEEFVYVFAMRIILSEILRSFHLSRIFSSAMSNFCCFRVSTCLHPSQRTHRVDILLLPLYPRLSHALTLTHLHSHTRTRTYALALTLTLSRSYSWTSPGGMLAAMPTVVAEYVAARALHPFRVVVHGAPGAGKSALAARIAAQQYVPHLQIGAMVDAALNAVRPFAGVGLNGKVIACKYMCECVHVCLLVYLAFVLLIFVRVLKKSLMFRERHTHYIASTLYSPSLSCFRPCIIPSVIQNSEGRIRGRARQGAGAESGQEKQEEGRQAAAARAAGADRAARAADAAVSQQGKMSCIFALESAHVDVLAYVNCKT